MHERYISVIQLLDFAIYKILYLFVIFAGDFYLANRLEI